MDLSHDEGEGAAAPKLSSRAAKNALTSAEKKKLRKKNQALKKKKIVKAKVAPQKKGEAPKPVEKKTRDFSTDLEAYLNDWAAFQQDSGHPWKFNKILQEWGIQNCVEKPKVAASLFKLLLPYLATVQGGARQRMEERMRNLIQNNGVEDGVSEEEEEKDRSRRVERAVKVLRALGAE